MLSLPKLIFLVVILLGVWGIYRFFERRSIGLSKDNEGAKVVDLMQCDTCGDWVEGACPRPDCKIGS